MEHVILVDELDREIGTMEKLEAHQKGLLHRAFSIIVFNSKGEMLIQKRAKTKYHSGGLWTNACCSHPIPNEAIEVAVKRRLKFEMGIEITPSYVYKFTYRTPLDKDLIEYEVDHVFQGTYNGNPSINQDEVEDWKFCTLDELHQQVRENPDAFTYWFKLILQHQLLRG